MLNKEKIQRKLSRTGLNNKQIAAYLKININTINHLLNRPSQLSPNNANVIKLCEFVKMDHKEVAHYIESSRKEIMPIENYIPMYPKSITLKELCKITKLASNTLINKLCCLETRDDVKIASEDGDKSFTRIK